MTLHSRLDQDLPTWFEGETSAPPADLLSRALARVDHVGQRPGLLTRDRYTSREPAFEGSRWLAPVALLLVLAVSGALVSRSGQAPEGRPGFASTTSGAWAPSPEVAFVAQVKLATDVPAFKWRAGAYSAYSTTGWAWGDVTRRSLDPDQALADVSPDARFPTRDGRRRIEITIWPASFRDRTVLGPNVIERVDRPTDAILVGSEGWLASVESRGDVGQYTITALIPRLGIGIDGISESSLRSAGTDYPAEVASIYTALHDGAMGPLATALLEDIRAEVAVPPGVDPSNPYDLARTMEAYLRSERFTYVEDVREITRNECPPSDSTVECFARIKQGYCEYYASTMAVLLRASGVPARIAYGFLPGERDAEGVEAISGAAAHWWVEVYFPGSGWFEFDPTGGNRGEPLTFPSEG